jgi:hypothetical protein
LFGLGNEEEDAEEDELSLDETSEGLREDERDRVPMAEAKKKKENRLLHIEVQVRIRCTPFILTL